MSTPDRYDLTSFLQEADLEHAGTGAITALPSYRSHAAGGAEVATRLDYQLKGAKDGMTSSCFPILYDTTHSGLYMVVAGRYSFPTGTVRRVFRPLSRWHPPEIKLNQQHKVDQVQDKLALLRLPTGTAPFRLEALTTAVVEVVAKTCRRKRRVTYDGWSPTTRSILLMQERILTILRHTRGSHKHSEWTEHTYRAGLRAVLKQWRKDAEQVAEEGGHIGTFLNPVGSKQGYDTWIGMNLTRLRERAEKAFYAARNMLHGRKRSDRRAEFRGFMAELERDRKEGRIRRAVLLLGGKPPKGGFSMDSLVADGVTETDPARVDSLLTGHFDDWFHRKGLHLAQGIEGDGTPWRHMEEPWERLKERYASHNIPDQTLKPLWTHCQRKTDKGLSEIETCPSFAEFQSAIAYLPKDSAAGISGLSYNMLKVLPTRVSKAFYEALAEIWNNKDQPESWKWRWILPIPKTQEATLEDLRPLSLFEATRKLWLALILTKLRAAWAREDLLHPAQTMFIKGRSMDLSVLSLMNVLETAKEWKSDIYLSSWDITKAFDRVPIQAQIWAYVRLGVPPQVAVYMVALDVDCRAVVRTPLACQS